MNTKKEKKCVKSERNRYFSQARKYNCRVWIKIAKIQTYTERKILTKDLTADVHFRAWLKRLIIVCSRK